MKKITFGILVFSIILSASISIFLPLSQSPQDKEGLSVPEIADSRIIDTEIPSSNGFEKGVSACFAGIIEDKLLIAGGCNFPDTPLIEGGKKRFYQDIFISSPTDTSGIQWKKVGKLPYPMAYGVSISLPQAVLCIGGSNERGALNSVLKISFNESVLQIDTLPSLPYSLDNMAGTLHDSVVYIIGGNKQGIPSSSLYALDLKKENKGWVQLPDFPQNPRTQLVCGVLLDSLSSPNLYIWGGFAPKTSLAEASLNTDGYCYSIHSQEWRVMEPPRGKEQEAISLGGGVALTLSDSTLLCLGGVNKDIFLKALNNPDPDYLSHPKEWYKFNSEVLLYNSKQDKWYSLGNYLWGARAGAAGVKYKEDIFYIQGELKPGIRTSEIVRISIKP